MILKYFFDFVKTFTLDYKKNLVNLFLISFIAGCFELIGVASVFPLILLISSPKEFNKLGILSDFSFGNIFILLSVLVVGAFLLKNILIILNLYVQTKSAKKWQLDVNLFFFEKYLSLTYEDKLKIPEKYSLFQVWQLSAVAVSFFVSKMFVLFSNALILIVLFVLLFYQFKLFTLLSMMFFVVAGYLQHVFFKRKGNTWQNLKLKLMNECNSSFMSAIRNVKDINIFGKEKYFSGMYSKYSHEITKLDTKIEFYNSIPQSLVEICVILSIVILSYGVFFSSNSSTLIPMFALLATALFRIAPLANKVQFCINLINSYKPVMLQLMDAYKYYNELKIAETDCMIEKMSFDNSINIKNIDYSYNDYSKVLSDFSLTIKKGEFLGIVGESGVGKTTLIDIILGLCVPKSGLISIDDKALTLKNRVSWLEKISYVPQEVTLLPTSIAQNIAFGQDVNAINWTKLNEVVKFVELSGYVSSLPNGLETKLSDLQALSQGQKQRLGIARALYKDFEVLVLDEFTSALDIETENKIIDKLLRFKGDKTVLFVAHRLSTLKHCDRIIQFCKDGNILEKSYGDIANSL